LPFPSSICDIKATSHKGHINCQDSLLVVAFSRQNPQSHTLRLAFSRFSETALITLGAHPTCRRVFVFLCRPAHYGDRCGLGLQELCSITALSPGVWIFWVCLHPAVGFGPPSLSASPLPTFCPRSSSPTYLHRQGRVRFEAVVSTSPISSFSFLLVYSLLQVVIILVGVIALFLLPRLSICSVAKGEESRYLRLAVLEAFSRPAHPHSHQFIASNSCRRFSSTVAFPSSTHFTNRFFRIISSP
jgi:hypothetical protein